jgi:osmotically-inducible protein OsmY
MKRRIAILLASWLLPIAVCHAQTSGGGSGGGRSGSSGGGSSGGSSAGIGTGTSSGIGTASAGGNRGGSSSGSTTYVVPSADNPFSTTYGYYAAQGLVPTSNVSTGTSSSSGSTSSGSSGGGSGSSSSGGAASNGSSNRVTVINSTAFGQPLYGTTTTTTVSTSATSTAGTGFNTFGLRKVQPYITSLSEDIPYVTHDSSQLRSDLQSVILRSSYLKNRQNIVVTVEQNKVVLRGSVPSQREKALAEAMVRLTPGVREVENLLEAPADKTKPQ